MGSKFALLMIKKITQARFEPPIWMYKEILTKIPQEIDKAEIHSRGASLLLYPRERWRGGVKKYADFPVSFH